jgi:hypothetical protein
MECISSLVCVAVNLVCGCICSCLNRLRYRATDIEKGISHVLRHRARVVGLDHGYITEYKCKSTCVD